MPGSVNTSGARCDGVTNDSPAIQAAVDAAGRQPGGLVRIPGGTCALFGSIKVDVLYGVTIEGAGTSRTFLVQHSRINIFQITSPGNTIEEMNLNTATYNPGTVPIPGNPVPAVLYSTSSNTTITNIAAEAGTGFGMRLVGPQPCYSDQVGGSVVSNITMVNHGTGGFAGVDISCQNGARLSNITIHGDMLALYEDSNMVLDGEVFYSGGPRCQPAWFVTGPAHNILIENVVTHSGVGRIHGVTSAITVTSQTVAPDAHCGRV